MAQCPTCGSDISENADFCPDCGTDLKPAGTAGAAPPAGSPAPAASEAPGASSAPPGDGIYAGNDPAPTSAPTDGGISSGGAPAAEGSAPATSPESAPTADAGTPSAGSTPESSAAPAEASTAPSATPEAPPAAAGDGGAGQARLILKRSGAATNEVFPIGGRVTLGRFDTETGPVDVDLGNLPEATYVSRQHAEMSQDGSGAWTIKDLGSRNGVFVRKQGEAQFRRISAEEPVASGDEIALGNARFELRVG